MIQLPLIASTSRLATLVGHITDLVNGERKQHLPPSDKSKSSNSKSILCASGPARTHAVLQDATVFPIAEVAHSERKTFTVPKFGGPAEVSRSVDAARRALYSKAKDEGGNVLVDEQWSCKVCSHSGHRGKDKVKVAISYSATAARSAWQDVQRPVGLKALRGLGSLRSIRDAPHKSLSQ